MATYEEIYGKRVKEFDSDPTLDSSYEGQVWYNTSDGVLKSVVNFFAFRSGGSMPVARDLGTGGGATQNSAWVAAGENGSTILNSTAEYNGFGWTTSGNVGTGRIRLAYGNNGPESAGLATGGFIPPSSVQSIVEEYNGSTWAAGTGLPTTIQFAGGTGPQTANIILGGTPPLTRSLEYDGSTWATGGSSSENLSNYGLAGIQTAALAFYGSQNSGGGPPHRTTGEEYNGASWSTVAPSLINQRGSGAATGTTSAAIFLGNSTTVTSWDGTSLTNEPAMSQSRGNGFSGGLATSGVVSGGSAPGSTANVEEFDRSINTITEGAWASGGAMNTARSQGTGAGTMTAGWIVGGSEPSLSNKTEEYNGTSWTAVNNLGMSSRLLAGAGPQTSAFATGGFTGPSTVVATVYNYDGTDWTAGAAQPVATYGQGSFGTQTAGVVCGGSSPTASNYQTTSFEYDGEGWTASPGSMNQGRHYIAGSGTQTAGLIAGGDKGSPGKSDNTEEYNGSTWTNGATTPDVRRGAGLSGPQTAALYFGGSGDPGARTTTFAYDGTSWSNMPSIATSRRLIAGGSKDGTTSSAWMAGGQLESPDARSALTEEFTGNTETVTSRTLTTS